MTDAMPDIGQAALREAGRGCKAGYAVFIVITSPDFKPSSPNTWPDRFTNAERVASGLWTGQALGFAQVFNRRARHAYAESRRDKTDWDHKWAIVVRHLKHNHPQKNACRRKGGAA